MVAGRTAVRFHIGLEDLDDLIADLERGFAALAAARELSFGPKPRVSPSRSFKIA